MQIDSQSSGGSELEEIRYPGLRYWKLAASFHVRHWADLVLVIPFLCVPVISDSLHSILIRQERSDEGRIRVFRALLEAVKQFPDLVVLKHQFWLAASLWSVIPIYGWYRDFQHRVNWSMASNVLVFEGLVGVVARRRCIALARIASPHSAFRTLITIPSMISVVWTVAMAVTPYVSHMPFTIAIPGFLLLWTIVPWSAAVNTFFYLGLNPDRPVSSDRSEFAPPKVHSHYCPRCSNYDQTRGLCSRLHFSVNEYPWLFQADCNATYFKKVPTLPASVQCPNCQTELELDEAERISFIFKCPMCQQAVDWSVDEQERVSK